MNYSDELNALQTLMTDSSMDGILIVYPNGIYDGSSDEWVRISSQTSKAEQMDIRENPESRYYGICYVQIFTKPDVGAGRAAEIVDIVSALLKFRRIDRMVFKTPKAVPVGVNDGWYQINVLTEFYRED